MIINQGVKFCHVCLGASVGGNVSRLITRTSERVRKQHEIHKGDYLPPHVWDPASKKMIPNLEFMRLYPKQAGQYYDESEKQKLKMKDDVPHNTQQPKTKYSDKVKKKIDKTIKSL